MRHRERQILMRCDQRLWRRKAGMRCLGIGLDNRREIRAGIGEQVFDAALREQGEVSLRDALGLQFLTRHLTTPAGTRFHLQDSGRIAFSSSSSSGGTAEEWVPAFAGTTG